MKFVRWMAVGVAATIAVTAVPAVASEPFRTHEGGDYYIDGRKYQYEVWQLDNNLYQLKVWAGEDYPKGPQVVLRRDYFSSSGEALKYFDCNYTERIRDRVYCLKS